MSNVALRVDQIVETLSSNPLEVLNNRRRPCEPQADAELLVREADRRIRNNLHVLVSLLNRRSRDAGPEVADALQAAAAQVSAVAALHGYLHTGAAEIALNGAVDLAGYLEGLVQSLIEACDLERSLHVLEIEMQPVLVTPDTARSLGLIVAELVSNAQRHAFAPGQSGTIRIAGRPRRTDAAYQIAIEDNGRGLPSDVDPRLRPTGFGLRLVSLLANQIRARLTVQGKPGTRFLLTLAA